MPAGWAKFGRTAAAGVVLGLVLAAGVEAASIFFGRNLHVVIPGQAYRCAQLSHDKLVGTIRDHGVRTVINLRGTGPGQAWYDAESRATFDADVAQEDVTLSAYKLPSPDELRRLINVFDHCEYPILFHCRQGVDRTGLAATLLLLLRTDATLAEARRQLSLRYGHVPIGPTWVMFQCLGLYEDWLRRQGREHSPDGLREWADRGYCPAHLRGRLELVELPDHFRIGVAAVVRVRAVNTSPEPWHLHPGTETGIHVRFLVYGPDLKQVQLGQAGLFEATVPPGGSIDLTLVVDPPRLPGTYFLTADLADGNRYAFTQFGNDPLELKMNVGVAAP
jgi:protein tyrosine phosphatase (PTP) superfamily phosphohydrolase (DUF442 family)